jgi:hypothetical protein
MKKFVFVYYGSKKHEGMSEEEVGKVMEAWKAWFGTFGDKMVDGGNPFATGGMSVTAKGAEAIPADMWPAKGYTIINAESMDEAVEVSKGCPVLEDDPEGAVRVYEAVPM